ncbi:MAG: hypothetical protein RIQ94_864 [Pseudomonadota bacterium]|jgi:two-component system phosphate regulon response regulator OmpR
MKQYNILIVDDDQRIRMLLQRYLSDQGFNVASAADGEQMTKKLERSYFDLIVLDWMLPGEDGLSICKRLYTDENSPPVIMLTANSSEYERVSGIESGAEDYLCKPFSPRELSARIYRVLRRKSPVTLPRLEQVAVCFGPFKLDFLQRNLTREGCDIQLTNAEFILLKVLAQNLGIPMSRERLSHIINGTVYTDNDRWLDVQISRLRRLLGDDPNQPVYLKTVRGIGYVLTQTNTLE